MKINSKDKAFELLAFYQSEIVNELKIPHSPAVLNLAIKFSRDHCDRMIDFIERELKGWLDTDLLIYWRSVKEKCLLSSEII